MNATLRKILHMCLQEKSQEEILKEVANTEKNTGWVEQVKSIQAAIEIADSINLPEKHLINGEVVWGGGCFDAARESKAVRSLIPKFSNFRGSVADEITNIIVNSSWSSKHSFARWKKDPSSVASEIRELFENV